MRRVLILLLTVGAVGISVTSSSAYRQWRFGNQHGSGTIGLQHVHELQDRTTGANSPHRLPVVADGEVSPWTIPDDRAYAHFLSALASMPNNVVRDIALRKAGLSVTDRQALVASLGSLSSDLRNLTEQRKKNSSPQIVQQQKAVFDDARDRAIRALTSPGRVQLDSYIQFEVKRRIKIYGGPMSIQPQELTR